MPSVLGDEGREHITGRKGEGGERAYHRSMVNPAASELALRSSQT